MTAVFQRYLSSGILMIWGVLMAYFYFSGRVSSYLHPSFHLWMAVSGVVLILMSVGILFMPQEADDFVGGGAVESPHGPRKLSGMLFSALVLTVPLIVSAIYSPSQFSATTVMNRGYVSSLSDLPGYQPYSEPALPNQDGTSQATQTQPTSDYLPRNAEGQIRAQTVDLIYAAEEPTMRQDFENQDVEMIGQFMPAKSNNPAGDRFNIVRMFIMCCAADARPVAVMVQTKGKTDLPEMSWVKVVGKATFPLEGGRRIPVIQAASVTPSEAPEETVIY